MEHRPDSKVLELPLRREAPPVTSFDPPDKQPGAPDGIPDATADPSFRRIFDQAMQLREMSERAREVYRTCPVDSFAGLSALLEMLLPTVDVLETRVADAVGLPLADLRQLAVGVVNPFQLPPAAIARLGRAAELSFDELATLSLRDQQRLRDLAGQSSQRESLGPARRGVARLRVAWESLIALDEPTDDD